MGVFDVLGLLLGLALFLYGMDAMGDALKRSAGSRLKAILAKMTSNPLKGLLLGFGVTAIIQSSSATTVMVVGFVNSGAMTLLQAVGVIMGAKIGTTVTAWLTGLSGLNSEAAGAIGWLEWFTPDAWMPILALLGICLVMFSKRGRKKDIGAILLGFAVLMTGMDLMSSSVSGLKESEEFASILTMFENPVLGVIVGAVITAIIQSSSASVGILQSLATTGKIKFGMAIPIIMGQNIGTCITALISSFGANKNGKRAAFVQLYINVIGTVIFLGGFYLIKLFVDMPFVENAIDMWGIAAVHSIYNIASVLLMSPFYKLLAKLAEITIRDSKEDKERINLLDERLFETPAVAVEQSFKVTCTMANISIDALKKSLELFENYDVKLADEIRDLEGEADKLEDSLGSYLVKLSALNLCNKDASEITKLLHIIGDLERISDHAVNIVESAEEMKDKKLTFSAEAQREIGVMKAALSEITEITRDAFVNNDMSAAKLVEPLEEVIDDIRDAIKLNHVIRLQKSECTIEHGFVLSDILNNFERVSDHCSNIAGCVIELSDSYNFEMHKYIDSVKHDSESFNKMVAEYKEKYSI